MQGISFSSPMELGVTKDYSMAYKLGDTRGKEGITVGINWQFALIIYIP